MLNEDSCQTNNDGISESIKHKNDFVNFNHSQLQNGKLKINQIVVSKFLERLRLRTVPYIKPLIQRLDVAEQKNLEALKSIDKINKRIKEIESYVENNTKLKEPKCASSEIAVGTDMCDPNSQEYSRLINSVNSSTIAPVKPRTSQARSDKVSSTNEMNPVKKQNGNINGIHNPILNQAPTSFPLNTDDFSNRMLMLAAPNGTAQQLPLFTFTSNIPNSTLTPLNPSIQALENFSIQFLPKGSLSPYLSVPKLTWKRVNEGVQLEWTMLLSSTVQPNSYQIYSFQKSDCSPSYVPWKLVGNTDALPLPMSCTLNMINRNETYCFVLRACVDHVTCSPWSNVVCVEMT